MRSTILFLIVSIPACSSEHDLTRNDFTATNSTPLPAPTSDVSNSCSNNCPTNPANNSDAGVAAPSVDASDASIPEPTCGNVVGHCSFNMGTSCEESTYDLSDQCKDLDFHPMGGIWNAGICGSDIGTDLHRSSGGCKNGCDISWSYPLGGGMPTDETRAAVKLMCEQAGHIYIPTGF